MGVTTTIIPQQINLMDSVDNDTIKYNSTTNKLYATIKPFSSDIFSIENATDVTQNNTSYVLYKTINSSGADINAYLIDFWFYYSSSVSHNVKVEFTYMDDTTTEVINNVVYSGQISNINEQYAQFAAAPDYTKKIKFIKIYGQRSSGTSDTLTISKFIGNFSYTTNRTDLLASADETEDTTAVSTTSTSLVTAKTYNFTVPLNFKSISIADTIDASYRSSYSLLFTDVFGTVTTLNFDGNFDTNGKYTNKVAYAGLPITKLEIKHLTSNATYPTTINKVKFYGIEQVNSLINPTCFEVL